MSKKYKILVFDFLLSEAPNLKSILDSSDTEVISTASYEEIVSYSEEQEFDLIIIHDNLKKIEPFKLSKTIRKSTFNNQTALLFICNSLIDEKIQLKVLELGGNNDFLVKPFSYDVLKLKINIILENSGLKKQLKKSENTFRSIVDNVPSGLIIAKKEDGQIIHVNSAFIDMFGYRKDELSGKSTVDFYSEEDGREQLLNEFEKKGYLKNYIFKLKKSNGEKFWASIYVRESIIDNERVLLSSINDISDQIETQKQLEILNERFNQARVAAKFGIWDYEINTDTLYWDNESHSLFETSEESFLGTFNDWSKIIHPDDLVTVSNELDLSQEKKLPEFEMVFRSITDNREIKYIKCHGLLYYDEEGICIRIVGIYKDITSLRKAQEDLVNSEKDFRELFETMAQGVVYQDKNGAIISANLAAEKILGLTVDQMKGLKSTDPNWRTFKEDGSIFHADEHPAMLTLKLGEPVHNTTMGVYNPIYEDITWILINSIPRFKDGETKPYQVYTTFNDITEQKDAQELIVKSKQQIQHYKEALDASAIIAVTDRRGRITYSNQHFSNVSGYSSEELKGETHRIVNSGYHSRDYWNNFWATISSGEIWRGEIKNKSKKGDYYWVDTTVFPMKNSDDKVTSYLAIRYEITDRKELESNLSELNKQKDRLFSILAHDLRGPFSGLMGLSAMLANDAPNMKTNEIQHIGKMLNKSSTNTYNLLDDILNWVRVQSKSHSLTFVSNDLLSIVDEIFTLFDENASLKSIKLINLIEKDLCVLADKDMLKAILRNLISNSLKFTPEGGHVKATCKKVNKGYIKISVKDDGVGMSTELVDNIKKSDLIDSKLGTKGENGSGFGLVLCKDLLKRHGSSLEVESEKGKGSKFSFNLSIAT